MQYPRVAAMPAAMNDVMGLFMQSIAKPQLSIGNVPLCYWRNDYTHVLHSPIIRAVFLGVLFIHSLIHSFIRAALMTYTNDRES